MKDFRLDTGNVSTCHSNPPTQIRTFRMGWQNGYTAILPSPFGNIIYQEIFPIQQSKIEDKKWAKETLKPVTNEM